MERGRAQSGSVVPGCQRWDNEAAAGTARVARRRRRPAPVSRREGTDSWAGVRPGAVRPDAAYAAVNASRRSSTSPATSRADLPTGVTVERNTVVPGVTVSLTANACDNRWGRGELRAITDDDGATTTAAVKTRTKLPSSA